MTLVKTLLGLFFIFINQALANNYTVISYAPANEPYQFAQSHQERGIFFDILQEVGKITGDTFEIKYFPVARALEMFNAGLVDIEPGINPVWRKNAKVPGLYSIAFGKSEEVIVFVPGKRFAVNKPEDLFGKKVGVVRGYQYPKYDPYFESGQIIRINNVSEELLLKQLKAYRVEQIFIGLPTILYKQKLHEEFRELEVGDVISSLDVMMRVHPSKAELLPRLNRAIQTLIETGRMAQIYAHYQFAVTNSPQTRVAVASPSPK